MIRNNWFCIGLLDLSQKNKTSFSLVTPSYKPFCVIKHDVLILRFVTPVVSSVSCIYIIAQDFPNKSRSVSPMYSASTTFNFSHPVKKCTWHWQLCGNWSWVNISLIVCLNSIGPYIKSVLLTITIKMFLAFENYFLLLTSLPTIIEVIFYMY